MRDARVSSFGMRALILGFAFGVGWLQWQPALPDAAQRHACVAVAIALALTLAGASVLRHAFARSLALPRIASSVRMWGRAAAEAVRALGVVAVATGGALAGFAFAGFVAERRLADELPPRWEGVDLQLIGTVTGLPAINRTDGSLRFALDVEHVATPEAVVPSRVSLAWFTSWRGARAPPGDTQESLPEVHAGERWALTVRLKRPHGTANPHGFDLEAWMLENGFRASGYVRKDDGNRRLDAFAGRLGDAIDVLRERIRERIFRVLGDRPYAGVIVALTIGDQRSVPQEQWLLYNRTGISHLLSISGLHVTLFATLAGGAIFHLWRRSLRLTNRLPARKAAAALGAVAAFAYVLLAGFEVPAQRTLYMLIVAAIGLWLGRPGTAFIVLLWALFVVLLLDPWAVLAPGFWLSFGAVGMLMYASVGRIRALESHWLQMAVVAQWTITVGMVPLMLALFQQVSLVSPLANAFAIPIVGMIVVPLALAWLVMPLDVVLIAAHGLFAWVVAALELLDALPSAVWAQHAPPPWSIAAGVAGILLLLAPHGLGVRGLGAVCLVPMFLAVPARPPPGAFWMTVLDVGQGLAVVLRTRDHALLYDTGPRFNDMFDAGNRIVAPHLRAIGVATLDGLVVTHRDLDHSGGALSVLSTLPVGWTTSSMAEDSDVVDMLRHADAVHVPCFAGQRWTWDGVRFDVLHPSAASYEQAKVKSNDRGCVLRVESRHGSALLTADIEARSEAELVARAPAALAADVIVVPHHGSKTSSTPAFVAAVDPGIAIATAGYRNHLGHPRPEVVARYVQRGVRFYRTDYDGAVEVRFENATPRVTAFRDVDERYWRDRPRPADERPAEPP